MSLITFEGCDGSGKTTVSERVFTEYDGAARYTTEPSGLWTGQVARSAFEDREASPLTLFHLMLADRAQHHREIVNPSIDKGFVVFCDRGPDSTRAYQGTALEGYIARHEGFIDEALTHLREPDLTIWLDVDPSVALKRSNQPDSIDDIDFQREVQKRYSQLHSEYDRIKRVNAAQPLDAVVEDALTLVQP